MKILNTFTSTPVKKNFYEVGDPIYTNGDFAAYSAPAYVIIAYKNVAINNLVKLNKEHVNALAEGKRPDDGPSGFLFDRAMESKERGLNLLNA